MVRRSQLVTPDSTAGAVPDGPAPAPAVRAAVRLGPRGFRGPGNGRVSYVESPPEWRATTVQACGLFPWAVGGGTPTLGVPVGRHLRFHRRRPGS